MGVGTRRERKRTRGEDKRRRRGGRGVGSFGVWSPVVLAHGELVFSVFVIWNVVRLELFRDVLCVCG